MIEVVAVEDGENIVQYDLKKIKLEFKNMISELENTVPGIDDSGLNEINRINVIIRKAMKSMFKNTESHTWVFVLRPRRIE